MKAKEITYEKTVSKNFNNTKIGIVVEIQEGEKAEQVFKKAKKFVDEKFEDVVDEGIPF